MDNYKIMKTRKYKTLWERAKRDRERLLKLKTLNQKANHILKEIKKVEKISK